jgi:hypothetical protein
MTMKSATSAASPDATAEVEQGRYSLVEVAEAEYTNTHTVLEMMMQCDDDKVGMGILADRVDTKLNQN